MCMHTRRGKNRIGDLRTKNRYLMQDQGLKSPERHRKFEKLLSPYGLVSNPYGLDCFPLQLFRFESII